MEILKKINIARLLIKQSKMKKGGYNEYSKYEYFTPEQINKLVGDACQEVGLFNKYDLLRTELGLMAELKIYDLETNSQPEVFRIAIEIPEIKATNVAQQLGGAVTYSERYLLMIAYDIKDNSIDFDSQKPKVKEKKPLPELTPDHEKWDSAKLSLKEGKVTIEQIRKYYTLSKENESNLQN